MSSVGHVSGMGLSPPQPPSPAAAALGAIDPATAARTRQPGPIARRLANTPGRLSAVSGVTMAALLIFGIVGALAVSSRAGALDQARDDAEQLVRIQGVRTNLVQADAAATNAYLAGGLEDPAQRQAYVTSIAAVSRSVAEAAARADGSETERLGAVNQALARYTGLIESARANNRQHFAVGAAYLRQASDLVRKEIQPTLITVSDDTANRVLDAYDASARASSALLIVIGAALVILVAGEVWLARRVRRILNVPLAAGTAIVLLAGILALVSMGYAQSRAEDVRLHSYAATSALAAARTAAYDAKGDESLRLILQGSGAGDTTWKALDAEVVRQLALARSAGAPDLDAPMDAWRAVHQQIRALDDGNDWRGAKERATSDADDSSNQAFDGFAEASQRELDAQVASARDDLSAAGRPLAGTALLVLGAGAVAALLARRGYAMRQAEYR